MEIDQILLDSIAEQLGPNRFSMWFDRQVGFALVGESLEVRVPNPFFKKMIRVNYGPMIEQLCRRLFARTFPTEYVVAPVAAPIAAPVVAPMAGRPHVGPPTRASNLPSDPPPSHTSPRNTPLGNISPTEFPSIEMAPDRIRLHPATVLDSESPLAVAGAAPLGRDGASSTARPAAFGLSRRSAGESKIPARKFASLDDFAVGVPNQLAKQVAEIAIAKPGQISPVLFHGPTAVGKTLLLEGIHSAYRQMGGRRHPLFLTAEQFTSEFVQRFQPGNRPTEDFRDRFKNLSLFVLDDLHFLKGRDKTQYELLTIMDRLRRHEVQLVMSSDRPLSELTFLKSELLSRLQGGFLCDMGPPDRQTLFEIFRRMVKQHRLDVPDEVGRLVVSRYAVNPRQLSGVLNRLHLSHLATGRTITVAMAEEVLADLVRDARRPIRLEEIERVVEEMFRMEPKSLRGKSRAAAFSHPRMVAMWLARKYTQNALSEIGRFFGNRSHSTVLSAQKRVEEWIAPGESEGANRSRGTMAETVVRLERILLG